MAYANDPATDRRISRLSLISSAAALYANLPPDPELVLAAAQRWEQWVYEGMTSSTNGTIVPPPETALVCVECGNPVTDVVFKNGSHWTVQDLAMRGHDKFGKVLCKTHYFGKKTV